MLQASEFGELVDRPAAELMPAAAAIRDQRFGARVTFSPRCSSR